MRVTGAPIVEQEVVVTIGKVDGAPHAGVARGCEQGRRGFHIGIAEEGAVTAVQMVALVVAGNKEQRPEGQEQEETSHSVGLEKGHEAEQKGKAAGAEGR